MGKPLVCVRARAPAHVHVRQFFGVDVCGRARTCAACPHLHFFTIKSLKPIKFRKKKCKKYVIAGARAVAKTGVRVRELHTIKMCLMCVLVQPKIRSH